MFGRHTDVPEIMREIGDEDYYSEGSFFTTEKFGCCLVVYAVFFSLGLWWSHPSA